MIYPATVRNCPFPYDIEMRPLVALPSVMDPLTGLIDPGIKQFRRDMGFELPVILLLL